MTHDEHKRIVGIVLAQRRLLRSALDRALKEFDVECLKILNEYELNKERILISPTNDEKLILDYLKERNDWVRSGKIRNESGVKYQAYLSSIRNLHATNWIKRSGFGPLLKYRYNNDQPTN